MTNRVDCGECTSVWSGDELFPIHLADKPCMRCIDKVEEALGRLRNRTHQLADEYQERTAKLKKELREYRRLFNCYRLFYEKSKKTDEWNAYWVHDTLVNGRAYWFFPSTAERSRIAVMVNENGKLREFIEKLLHHHERHTDHLCDWRAYYAMIDPAMPKGLDSDDLSDL